MKTPEERKDEELAREIAWNMGGVTRCDNEKCDCVFTEKPCDKCFKEIQFHHLIETIAQALRQVRNEAYEAGAKIAERISLEEQNIPLPNSKGISGLVASVHRDIAKSIRQLKREG